MLPLNLPPADLTVREENDRMLILDQVRGSFVLCTPEEWVRQHFIHFMTAFRGVPVGLIAVEKAFDFQGMTRRADIVVYNRHGQPWLVVECKAPDVELKRHVFEQVGRYNRVIKAPYVGVTNGLEHFCFSVDGEIRFHSDFPLFPKQHPS
ncbi:MAG: type I restriction enzyme HsdR N-terminal domain-containing protein [Rhodothermales bacterium]|nr:type I restriction enzyme HsdR N-terminal domain-containing protein [Rhodothermales bacterium]